MFDFPCVKYKNEKKKLNVLIKFNLTEIYRIVLLTSIFLICKFIKKKGKCKLKKKNRTTLTLSKSRNSQNCGNSAVENSDLSLKNQVEIREKKFRKNLHTALQYCSSSPKILEHSVLPNNKYAISIVISCNGTNA